MHKPETVLLYRHDIFFLFCVCALWKMAGNRQFFFLYSPSELSNLWNPNKTPFCVVSTNYFTFYNRIADNFLISTQKCRQFWADSIDDHNKGNKNDTCKCFHRGCDRLRDDYVLVVAVNSWLPLWLAAGRYRYVCVRDVRTTQYKNGKGTQWDGSWWLVRLELDILIRSDYLKYFNVANWYTISTNFYIELFVYEMKLCYQLCYKRVVSLRLRV